MSQFNQFNDFLDTCMPLPYPLPKVTKPVVTSYSPSPSATISKPALPPDGDFQQEPIYDNIPSREPWTSSRKNSSSSNPSSAEVLPQGLFMRELNGVCSPSSLEKETVADPLVVASDQVALIERLGESRFGEVGQLTVVFFVEQYSTVLSIKAC